MSPIVHPSLKGASISSNRTNPASKSGGLAIGLQGKQQARKHTKTKFSDWTPEGTPALEKKARSGRNHSAPRGEGGTI